MSESDGERDITEVGEHEAVRAVEDPVTVSSLAQDLRELGVASDETLLVHSSLGSLGWVCGGAQAVVDALLHVVDDGTLVMPTHTGQYSDPTNWQNPPVPDDWVPQIHESMPPFRPAVTPTRSMGAIPECFRSYPGVRRSRHPEVSFAARGEGAEAVVADHSLDFGLGDGSPLARVYDRGGKVLLLGTGHGTNTSLHLAEYRADIGRERVEHGAPVVRDGERVWVEYEDIETSTEDFPDIGADFERERPECVETGWVGAAEAALLDQRALVDFAVEWFGSEAGKRE